METTTVTATPKKATSHERKAFGLRVLKNSHPEIKKIRKEGGCPSIHGNKFWKSTYIMMDYLQEFPPDENARILEVGCGWGLSGIFAAQKFAARVTALDADETVFPYLHHHAALNKVTIKTWKCRYENIRKIDLKNFDLIIGADVCFWDEMTRPLFNLTRRAHSEGLRVVMTDPGREPFREMAMKCYESFPAEYANWSVPHPHNASGLVLDVYAKHLTKE